MKPFKPSSKVEEFACSIDFEDGFLFANYHLRGSLDNLIVRSKSGQPLFKDELWKATVFEIFLKKENAKQYYEWNLCPSTFYASYLFESYREPQPPSKISSGIPEVIHYHCSSSRLDFNVKIPLPSELLECNEFKIQISAILDFDGQDEKEFFALKHPGDQADFHNQECFQCVSKVDGID